MNKNIPPGKQTLPPAAEEEIMDTLFSNMRISSDEIAAILKKHGVSGDANALQDATASAWASGSWLVSGTNAVSGKFWLTAASTLCWNAATTKKRSRPSGTALKAR